MGYRSWQEELQEQHRERKKAGLWRYRRTLGSAQQAFVELDGQWLTNFSSNDYLGLASHPALESGVSSSVGQWGGGAGASHLVCGHQSLHQSLESRLADFVGAERAVLFSNGYMANLAMNTVFSHKRDLLLHDRLNHASLIDGARLSAATFKRYRHCDITHAQKIILAEDFKRLVMVTDGVFSMDGDVAPLCGLKALADQNGGLLCVDDAHGFAVLGRQGAGVLSGAGMKPAGNILMMGTLSKALGGYGAFVAGDEVFVEHLIQFARTYTYTTALPPTVVSSNIAALELVRRDHAKLYSCVFGLVDQFKRACMELSLPLMNSDTPIQPILIGDEVAATSISRRLQAQGFLVAAIRTPTVPKRQARLRITLTASHTSFQVEALVAALAEVLSCSYAPLRRA